MSDTARITTPTDRYVDAGGFGAKAMNWLVEWLARRGLGLAGARVLEVKGRTSGEWRTTPVNPLEHRGEEYLVAPRGHTQWVRNLRVAPEGRLRKGRSSQGFTAVELDDAAKPDILRAYLRRWQWQVSSFFAGVDADATDEQLLAVAAGYPVFRITRTTE